MAFTRDWIECAAIRAVKTMAQGMVAMIGTNMVNIVSLDWMQILGCAATMGVLSILTSLAGLPEVDDPDELTDEEVEEYPEAMDEVDISGEAK